jgi:hypothetical protein
MESRVQMDCQNSIARSGAERSVNIGNIGDCGRIPRRVGYDAGWRRRLSEKRDFATMIIRMFSRFPAAD